jgi:hypothetical protein
MKQQAGKRKKSEQAAGDSDDDRAIPANENSTSTNANNKSSNSKSNNSKNEGATGLREFTIERVFSIFGLVVMNCKGS